MNNLAKRRAALPTTVQPTPRLTVCNTKICNPVANTLNVAPVVAPNLDTMYGAAQLDLAQTLLLQIPPRTQPIPNTNPPQFFIGPMDNRYFGITFIDAYSNVVLALNRLAAPAALGGRFCFYANPAQEAICNVAAQVGGFTWQGKFLLPRYVTAIARAWSTGLASANPCLDPQTNAINFGIDGCNFLEFMVFQNLTAPPPTLLNPFNEFKDLLSPVAGSCGAAPDSGIPCGVSGNRKAYWDTVCKILKMSPPSLAEANYINTHFGSLGISSTGNCNLNYDELNAGFDLGYQQLASVATQQMTGAQQEGWVYLPFSGTWDVTANGLFLRAVTAQRLFYMEPNGIVAYWAKFTDNVDVPLAGAGGAIYKITFSPGEVPIFPPAGFYSMTVYADNWFLHPNPANKHMFHALAPTPPPIIYLSADCSGAPVASGFDCLPVPTGFFRLLFRGYAAKPALAPNGGYVLPDVQRCAPGSGYC